MECHNNQVTIIHHSYYSFTQSCGESHQMTYRDLALSFSVDKSKENHKLMYKLRKICTTILVTFYKFASEKGISNKL